MKKLKEVKRLHFLVYGGIVLVALFALVGFAGFSDALNTTYHAGTSTTTPAGVVALPTLDKNAYNAKLLFLAHINMASTTMDASTTTPKGIILLRPATATTTVSAAKKFWPVATVYPNAGALLPFNRIVAYYGNFYSTKMGVLGQDPPDVMIPKLQEAAAEWQAADPATPVIPALDYIVVVAQGSAGKDGMYRARMPDSEIQKAIDLMAPLHGIVFLDVQTGLSTLHDELPLLTPFLKLPNVELSLDPEFYMAYSGKKPGGVIGTMDASDVNYAASMLANIVRQNNLPPKILVVHRFTEEMVTHATKIVPLPEVQIVMDMDGWGTQAKKIGTYTNVIAAEPVQFTGFKLFYKNDVKAPSTGMLTPAQVLNLTPAPSYIQYQ